jgi:hypothetical protein
MSIYHDKIELVDYTFIRYRALFIFYLQWKNQILELFNMKLSKTIDQTRISTICKKSYDDPLGYFCMGFFFTCPDGQVTHKFHLSNGRFHLSRTIGQTLLSRPAVSEETIF